MPEFDAWAVCRETEEEAEVPQEQPAVALKQVNTLALPHLMKDGTISQIMPAQQTAR